MGHSVCLANLFVLSLSLLTCAAEAKTPPPRRKVVIEGYVSCVYCVIETGPGSVIKEAPLPGAAVKVQCDNKKKGSWEEETTTDGGGNYVLRPGRVTSWGAHKCKVFLVSLPRPDCPVITYSGSSGVVLKATNNGSSSTSQIFAVPDLNFVPGPYMCL